MDLEHSQPTLFYPHTVSKFPLQAHKSTGMVNHSFAVYLESRMDTLKMADCINLLALRQPTRN